MSNTKQKTCQERIEEEYRRADDYLELIFRVYDDDLDEDDEDDKEILKQVKDEEIDNQTIYEYAAGSSMKRLLTIELSGGGPSSHIEAIINEDNVKTNKGGWFTIPSLCYGLWQFTTSL